MAEQKKFLDANGLKKVKEDYEGKIGTATADVVKNVTVQGVAGTVAEGTATVDLTSVLAAYATTTSLGEYLKGTDADGKYATKEEAKKVSVQIVEQSALEGLKESSAEGAMAIVSDDSYHLYIYDGTDWQDTGAHVDLSGYLKSADAEGKYAAKTALDAYLKTEDIATTLTDYTTDTELTIKLADYLLTATADGKYATKDELTNLGTILGDCTFEELETNKEGATKGDCYVVTDKGNHIFYYNGTDFIDTQTVVDLSLYAKTTDLAIALTDEEIEAVLNPDV